MKTHFYHPHRAVHICMWTWTCMLPCMSVHGAGYTSLPSDQKRVLTSSRCCYTICPLHQCRFPFFSLRVWREVTLVRQNVITPPCLCTWLKHCHLLQRRIRGRVQGILFSEKTINQQSLKLKGWLGVMWEELNGTRIIFNSSSTLSGQEKGSGSGVEVAVALPSLCVRACACVCVRVLSAISI